MDTAAPDQNPAAAPEKTVLEWQEPVLPATPMAANLPAVIGVSGLLIVLFVLGGYFLKYGTLYLAAFVPLAACFMLLAQARRPAPPRTVSLTTERLVAGNRTYALTDLAGFWLSKESTLTVVNVEPNKPSPFPISLLYPSTSQEEVRDLLLQSLPEVEARATDMSDSLGRFIKL